ncbi:MAG TPA: class II aldolase/adducin family protein [Xanthobacteraceae bacterium]|nr:class II aldolase/adducin family protein [Xanthobacteraceae bacterium]
MSAGLRETLANAGRVLALEGQGDYVAGHVSVRLPDDPGRFLMKPAGIGLEEMRPDNIITVDLDGRKVDGTMPRHNEVFIHSEVFRARPDVNAVVHTHPMHAVAFSSLGKPLLAVGNDASWFVGQLPIFAETTDLIIDAPRGRAVARCLGPHAALILRNHGIVTAAASIEEAVWVALKLEKACQVQLLAEAAGGPRLVVEGDDLKKKAGRSNRGDLHRNVFDYLVRRWRCVCCGERVDAPQVTAFEKDNASYDSGR